MIKVGDTEITSVVYNGTTISKVYVNNGSGTSELVYSATLSPLLKNVNSNTLSNATLSNASGSANAYKGFNSEGLTVGYSPSESWVMCEFNNAVRVEEIRVNVSNYASGSLNLSVYNGTQWISIGSVSANGDKTWTIESTITKFRLSYINTECKFANLNAYHYK